MIKDGRPYTNENGSVDDGLMSGKDDATQKAVFGWIDLFLDSRKNFNRLHTSYGLKHLLQSSTGIYLTNNEFKDAMMSCGYLPEDPDALNWVYAISEKSLAFNSRVMEKVKNLAIRVTVD